MSKAEERALKVYPVRVAQREGYDENLRERKGFIKGYHQAEKDLELTWEDIKILRRLISTKEINDGLFDKEDYEEVLKYFKDFKERKINTDKLL